MITLTTVGYGDLAPSSPGSKLFTVAYILLGLGILVAFLSAVARHAVELRVERQSGKDGKPGDGTGTF